MKLSRKFLDFLVFMRIIRHVVQVFGNVNPFLKNLHFVHIFVMVIIKIKCYNMITERVFRDSPKTAGRSKTRRGVLFMKKH